jgi:hypothetical protein
VIVCVSPGLWSSANTQVKLWTLSGRATGPALGSPVSFCDSEPVTNSVFVIGNRLPFSVASRKYLPTSVCRRPSFVSPVTALTASRSTAADTGDHSRKTVSLPDWTPGSSIASSSANQTRGSAVRRETQELPGLSRGFPFAAFVSAGLVRVR